MGGLPDRRIDHRRRVIGSVGRDMHEQFVVQAQHDLGTEGPSPTADRDCPHLEEFSRRALDHGVAGITTSCCGNRHGSVEVSVSRRIGPHSDPTTAAGDDILPGLA